MKRKFALILVLALAFTLMAACSRDCRAPGCKKEARNNSFYCEDHKCKVEKCSELAVEDGYCNKHYLEWLGAENGATAETPEEPEVPSEAPVEEPSETPAPDITGKWVYQAQYMNGEDQHNEMLMGSTFEFFADGTCVYIRPEYREELENDRVFVAQGTTQTGNYEWNGEMFTGQVTDEDGLGQKLSVRVLDENTIRNGNNMYEVFTRVG